MRSKTKSAVIVLMLCSAAAAFAQGAPSTVSFVARLQNGGQPLSGNHDFVFAIYDQATGGSQLWTETRNTVPVAQGGLLYLDLGSVTPLDAATVFTGAPRYLEITIDGTVSSPRIVLESVPYALRAGTATKADDADLLGGNSPSSYQARVAGTCPSGQSIQTIDSAGGVTCEIDQDTTYTAAAAGGLSLSGTAFSINAMLTQARVTGTCSMGAIATIAQDGSVTCLTAGAGLTASSGKFAVDFTTVQHAMGACASGSVVHSVDSAGNPTCYSAGTGLSFNSTTSQYDVDTSAVQARVTGTCSVGSAITAINADGTVTCGSSAATPVSATRSNSGTRNNTSYGNLSGGGGNSGPSVTVTIPASGQALVTITASIAPAANSTAYMSFSGGGVNDSDSRALSRQSTSNGDTGEVQASATYFVTGLTAGSQTITADYRSTSGTATFQDRSLIVTPVP